MWPVVPTHIRDFTCKLREHFLSHRSSNTLKHNKSRVLSIASYFFVFTCSLRMMCLDDVYCELPTDTPGSPSSCSPVCRTLPVIKNEMSWWLSRQESPGHFLGSYLLPNWDLGLQLIDAVLYRLLAVMSMRRWDCHHDTGLTHLHPPEGETSLLYLSSKLNFSFLCQVWAVSMFYIEGKKVDSHTEGW